MYFFIKKLIFFLFLTCGVAYAQEPLSDDLVVKKFALSDRIVLDSVSINPSFFTVSLKNGASLDTLNYTIDYSKSLFRLRDTTNIKTDSLIFKYKPYPKFLTKKYFLYDRDRIVNSSGALEKVYALKTEKATSIIPFDGLTTSGSIVRGVTVGNNQNSTVTSELDLQISGKLSDKVGIRASIQDANIPQQNGGYSQRLDEFDQIFIELYSDTWNIRAGDINLIEDQSYFGRFNKKVQGLSLQGTIDHSASQTNLFATGAIVRGVYTRSSFIGQEGNQGPYKLTGPNGELYVLIIAGSERVYANGVLLERGENADYVIDYNAGELRFNPTFPITSEMRIEVEYQFSEQNYTRLIGYGGGGFQTDDNTFTLRAHVYTESDAKNQPLLQNLNAEQVGILQQAGDDPERMVAPSASPDSYSENKILYRKELHNGNEIFVFSNSPTDELFNVRFTQVGANQGNYVLSTNDAINRIYEYVSPINGIPQGNYEPSIRLFAPTKLQMAVVQGSYAPSQKTQVAFEAAGSNNDQNLFSSLDDADNKGFAGRLKAKHQFLEHENKSQLHAYFNTNYIQEQFNNVERTYSIEFSRDWNLPIQPLGDQTYINSGLQYNYDSDISINYAYEHLNYSTLYGGHRHSLHSSIQKEKFHADLHTSYLKTNADTLKTDFFRLHASAVKGIGKTWVGAKVFSESNLRTNPLTARKDSISQRYLAYETFAGLGDSTQVYVELGYRHRINDSLRENNVTRVNTSNTYYLKSQLLNTKNTRLGVYLNYRKLSYVQDDYEDEQSLNSRLLYNQFLFNRIVRWNTVFETSSGTLPQQEFTYIKVDEGQGTHTWNDYNGDGIQQLQEFEIAQFTDEADFIRVLLPNQVFIKTHQNKLSQTLTLDFSQWNGQDGFKQFLSHFYNQSSFLIDKKIEREGDAFDINPFNNDDNTLGLTQTFRNTLFLNRGKQKYTTSYNYLSTQSKNLLSIGLQENNIETHQLDFTHRIQASYLFNLLAKTGINSSASENFTARNFKIDQQSIQPKVSYLFNDNSRVSAFYTFSQKENTLGDQENLLQNNLGFTFAYAKGQQIALNGEFKYIHNTFEGSAFSPVAYQILEGLQPGKNFTWNLIAQKRLTKFLDLNLNYFGRKSKNSNTIHTGTIQLRAFF